MIDVHTHWLVILAWVIIVLMTGMCLGALYRAETGEMARDPRLPCKIAKRWEMKMAYYRTNR